MESGQITHALHPPQNEFAIKSNSFINVSKHKKLL